ncbi:unnamed protein product [Menidia menidia]|uniref:(Atlantic silverside) hypothetical protein n=1 Tax=Menidia menidia TaxID=238744 RepID=A0A8S4B735_9TELE|nr:unnamed protein product [Menidia menidia]
MCTLNDMDVSTAVEIATVLQSMKDVTHIMLEDSTYTLSVIAPLTQKLLALLLTCQISASNCFLFGSQIQSPAFPLQRRTSWKSMSKI